MSGKSHPDIVVSPWPAIGDIHWLGMGLNQEWGAPELEVRDSCGLVSVTSTENPLVVETAPVQGGIVTYPRDGPRGTSFSRDDCCRRLTFCPTAGLVDSDGDGLHDLEDNCPAIQLSQHDQDNDDSDPQTRGERSCPQSRVEPQSQFHRNREPGVVSLQTPEEYVGIEDQMSGGLWRADE